MALNYVSVSDLKDMLSDEEQAKATDEDSDINTDVSNLQKDPEMIERFLERAESRVEAYLTGYDLPLDTVPPVIEWAVIVIATYMLMLRGDLAVSDPVDRAYEEVLNWLRSVQSGNSQVPTVDEDDDDFVGFGTKDDMDFDKFPHRRFKYLT